MNRRVLVVDDDLPTLEVMELILRKIGCEPLVADNGMDAVHLIKAHVPELVLMDVMMSPMNGWQILETMMQDPEMRNVPVILFTAKRLEDEEISRYGSMVAGVLEKPISPSELRNALQIFFDGQKISGWA
ncbi:MAG: response regulator [Methanomicrobiales archaeon]|nr:response regulator [Methanomicrobiales archaeon]MDI6875255.1 response regulator [Methanomicrobiales archaeon]